MNSANGNGSGIFQEDLFWQRDNSNNEINFKLVEKVVELSEVAFLKWFWDPNTQTVKESFFTHAPEYEDNFEKYAIELTEALKQYDERSDTSCQPASRFLYLVHQLRCRKGELMLQPMICPTFIKAVIDSVLQARVALKEASPFFCCGPIVINNLIKSGLSVDRLCPLLDGFI